MPSTELRTSLASRIQMGYVRELCNLCVSDPNLTGTLYELTSDTEKRVAVNALWVLTHVNLGDAKQLLVKHDDLIDKALAENIESKLRMELQILLTQPFDKETIRPEFIDFCLENMVNQGQPYAIRALCMKLAYEQMAHYPEMLCELRNMLEMLSGEELSPGLMSAWKRTMTLIEKKLKAI